MASGGIRSDVTVADSMTPFEDRNFKHRLRDSNGDDITDFGVREFSLYILGALEDADGIVELDAESLLKIADGDMTKAPPYVSSPISVANWTTIRAAQTQVEYAYELWRVDAGNVRRLARGDVPLTD